MLNWAVRVKNKEIVHVISLLWSVREYEKWRACFFALWWREFALSICVHCEIAPTLFHPPKFTWIPRIVQFQLPQRTKLKSDYDYPHEGVTGQFFSIFLPFPTWLYSVKKFTLILNSTRYPEPMEVQYLAFTTTTNNNWMFIQIESVLTDDKIATFEERLLPSVDYKGGKRENVNLLSQLEVSKNGTVFSSSEDNSLMGRRSRSWESRRMPRLELSIHLW